MGVEERRILKAIRSATPSVIGVASELSLGSALGALNVTPASVAWTSSLAIYVPFYVSHTVTITRVFAHNGSAVSGNIEVGIYTSNSITAVPATKIASASATQAGTSQVQTWNLTDTTLAAGRYFMALVIDNGTGTNLGWTVAAHAGRRLGMFVESAAYPLPSTATIAAATGTLIPAFGISRTDSL